MSRSDQASSLQACLTRLAAGDPQARAELIRLSRDRLLVLTRAMLKHYPQVRRWEESDDVLQNALMRLDTALQNVPLEDVNHFLAIAALNIRREIVDLSRHYFGAQGQGANYATPPRDSAAPDRLTQAAQPFGDDPAKLLDWTELHHHVEQLPADEKEVFDLFWYHGMSKPEVAAALGTSVRTVKRRWVKARLLLSQIMGGEAPE